jgi:pyruvate,water dikinase
MKFIIPVKDINDKDLNHTGGKARALGAMTQKGMNVPEAITITTEAYDTYVTATGLRTNIMMELNRKTDEDIRWEELWDISLRIRNLFVNTPLPGELYETIKKSVESYFTGTSVVVRSSAPGEDTAGTSFAGLHASYVNVKGAESIIEHIKLVWASLWSDASLLYRKELGLDESKSSMAVVVQEIVTGEVSGIGFGQNPNDPSQCIIESVYGLNQGLVDGTLEPDRWILDRAEGGIISHTAAERNQALYPSEGGTALALLPPETKDRPPLTDGNVRKVYRIVMNAEEIFGLPQDVEWTMKDNIIYVLQSRPITTLAGGEKDDKRGWYLSLTKSFENLKSMRHTIEEELIPDLQKETEDLAKTDVSHLSDGEVESEAARRRDIFAKWKKIYWDYFIPFAHGMRLFGTVYNDTVHPDDPYEFLSLLSKGNNMVSIQRNDILQQMASRIQGNNRLTDQLKEGNYTDTSFSSLLRQFVTSHGDLLCRSPLCEEETPDIINMVIEMASADIKGRRGDEELTKKEQMFLSLFEGQKRKDAEEMLDIGRASYNMRDNDNIYMGRLKARVLEAENELSHRSGTAAGGPSSAGHFDSVSLDVNNRAQESGSEHTEAGFRLQARQITGQPAGPGIATGSAHVISNASDLMNFKKSEVLVCDSIDPNMTFAVPLASAIVERRGGMLIHGAIIAREYGLPCVTGITRATELIKTGDRVTVDGYLGIVIIDSASHGTSGNK